MPKFNTKCLKKSSLGGSPYYSESATMNKGIVFKNKMCSAIFKGASQSNVKSLFNSVGLGRATMRGIRRCPECGTMNGTKANVCKNKSCDAVFKDTATRKKGLSETCRLNTGTFTQVFSVRVRDRSPDYRGFVQLPVAQSKTSDLLNSTALCFVDCCQGNFKTKVLQCHEVGAEQRPVVCHHIDAALQCNTMAIPLPVNTTILEALNVDHLVKKEVNDLLAESSGPAVQRVSKNAIAVKCRVSSKFPLGFLHTTFVAGRTDSDLQFFCPCSTFKDTSRVSALDGRCPHFYACICAFVNQHPLREEFSSYIRLEVSLGFPCSDSETVLSPEGDKDHDSSDLTNLLNCHVEILEDSNMSAILSDVVPTSDSGMQSCSVTAILGDAGETSDSRNYLKRCEGEVPAVGTDSHCGLHESLTEDAIVFSTEPINQQQEVTNFDLDTLSSRNDDNTCYDLQNESSFVQQDISGLQLMPLYLAEEPPSQTQQPKKRIASKPHLSFLEWLGTVTESINQHMHYQFPGNPNALVFHTPKKFFEKLKERMYRSQRMRVASNVTVFTRQDAIPVGTFVKHTYTLTSRFHVKAVFDTPQIPLKLVRSFVRSSDGTYDPAEHLPSLQQAGSPLYKTYLRIGLHRGETEPVPFKVEWIPNVLPVSHIGELRVNFEFGHVPYPPEHFQVPSPSEIK